MVRKRSDSLFGSIVVREYGVTLRTLQEALDKQKKHPELLGNILIGMRVLTKDQVLAALDRQVELRRERDGY